MRKNEIYKKVSENTRFIKKVREKMRFIKNYEKI